MFRGDEEGEGEARAARLSWAWVGREVILSVPLGPWALGFGVPYLFFSGSFLSASISPWNSCRCKTFSWPQQGSRVVWCGFGVVVWLGRCKRIWDGGRINAGRDASDGINLEQIYVPEYYYQPLFE